MEAKIQQKPHAVCMPFPAQGHINPMLHLAKLLHHSGFHITFVHTIHNYSRLLKSCGPVSMNGLPDFQFKTIPDGLPLGDDDATRDIPSLCESIGKNCLGPFRELFAELQVDARASTEHVPLPTCIVSDNAMWFTVDAAEEFEVPVVSFRTTSACGFLTLAHFPNLIEKGLIPLKDEGDLTNGYLDTKIDFIPGMESVRLRDFPSFLRTTNPDHKSLKAIERILERSPKASAIILNTFDALEQDVLNELCTIYPYVLSIGPLHLSANRIPVDSPLNSIRSCLWQEEPECIKWLSSKEPHSVVYVNFGSITVLSQKQLEEFAWGLANSQTPFLWIVRPDLVAGDSAILPPEFIEATKSRGFLAGWCTQEQVLSHPSIGGFLTHCGWNSTLESISAGVPMICWPFFAEQHTNCWFASTKCGIGMEIGNDVKRADVEKLVRELIVGKEDMKMKRKAAEWKRLAEAAIDASGSSSQNFNKMVKEVLCGKLFNSNQD